MAGAAPSSTGVALGATGAACADAAAKAAPPTNAKIIARISAPVERLSLPSNRLRAIDADPETGSPVQNRVEFATTAADDGRDRS